MNKSVFLSLLGFMVCVLAFTACSSDNDVNVTGVSLSEKDILIEKGSSHLLKAVVSPENATNKDVKWTTSDAHIASVDNKGNVTALKTGTATITVCSPSSPIARAPLMSLRRGPVLPPPAGSSSLAFPPSQPRSTPPQNPSAAPASGSSLFPPSSPRWFAALPSHSSFSLCSPTPGSFCSTPSYRLALPQP